MSMLELGDVVSAAVPYLVLDVEQQTTSISILRVTLTSTMTDDGKIQSVIRTPTDRELTAIYSFKLTDDIESNFGKFVLS